MTIVDKIFGDYQCCDQLYPWPPMTQENVMNTPWMDRAKKEMGVKEVPGRKDNPRIVEYLKSTTYDLEQPGWDDEIPWCSAFVNWIFKQEGIKGTNSAWSQSWREWGKGLSDPTFGCVVVFSWGGNKGHVGFVWDWDDDGIFVLGGNQHNSVNITYFSYDNVVAYRMPKAA